MQPHSIRAARDWGFFGGPNDDCFRLSLDPKPVAPENPVFCGLGLGRGHVANPDLRGARDSPASLAQSSGSARGDISSEFLAPQFRRIFS